MLQIGIAGIGFMGHLHFLAARRVPGISVAAIQSRDANKRSGDWRGIRGNFGPPGAVMDLTGVTAYESFDQLIADPLVDLVDLTVPTPQHEFLTIQALRAGKHVLVEKPIALEVAAAERMVAAARKSRRLLMVAHVVPCFPEFRFALDAVNTGRFGKLLAGQFLRVIAHTDPSLSPDSVKDNGGPALDLHIHDTHFIRTIAGLPIEVDSAGKSQDGVLQHLTTVYRYADGPALSATSGALVAAGRPWVHGFELYFEQATVTFGPGQPLMAITDGGSELIPADGDVVNVFAYELERVAASVAAGKAEPFLDAATARDALIMCHKEIESVRSGQPIRIAN